jgi:vacuolar-type H+-ATPase subunit E/Vma4
VSETSRFTEDILTAAKEKARTIMAEAEAETQKALEDAKSHMSKEAETILRNARAESEGVKRRQMSDVRHRLKLQEQAEKSKILTDVLDQTKKRAVDFTDDETRYFPFLVNLVVNGIRELGLGNVIIHLNARDIRRIDRAKFEREVAKKLESNVKIEFSKEPLEASGGVVVSNIDGRTRIVNTLDERFEALESKLLVEAGKLLFAG